MTRSQGDPVIPAYRMNTLEAAEVFDRWILEPENPKLVKVKDMFQRLHKVAAFGHDFIFLFDPFGTLAEKDAWARSKRDYEVYLADGRLAYRTVDINPGEFRREFFRQVVEPWMVEYTNKILIEYSIERPHRGTQRPDDRPEDSASVLGNGKILLPRSFDWHFEKLHEAILSLKDIRRRHSSGELVREDDIIDTLGRVFYYFVGMHVFMRINHSLISNSINRQLIELGMSPVYHGWIDYFTFFMKEADFLKLYKEHVRGNLKTPFDFGLDPRE